MRVLIIADDLTGALDSAVPFASAGLRAVVARRPSDVGSALRRRPDVLAVSTASREGDAVAARAAVEAALDAAGPLPPVVFKKVDSRLKGHVGDEAAALAWRTGSRRALVAPAIPSQGRHVRGGRVCGAGVAAPIDVAAALERSGLALDVPDTAGDADLDAALRSALAPAAAGGPPPVLVGAAGLAAALARHLAPEPSVGAPAAPGFGAPILLAIGSHDPITLAQAARLADDGLAECSEAPEGACPALPPDGFAQLVRLTAVAGRAFDAACAGRRFAEGIARLVGSGRFATLLACGGETADAILGALDQGVLKVAGEALPGAPVSTMLVGGRRLELVTKSGGFGGEDALAAIVRAAGGLAGSVR